MELYYKCKPSVRVVLITSLVVLLILIMAMQVFMDTTRVGAIIALLFILTLVIVTLIQTPRQVCVSDKAIILHCLLWKKNFYYSHIKEINRIYAVGGIRRFGSNGMLGYIGILDGQKRYYTYFNHERNMIEINYDGKWYVVSCTHADDLVDKVKAKVKAL